MNNLSIAIVDSNILAGIGLQQILEDIMPMADIQLFTTFEELAANKDSHFIHFFVASRIYFEHAQYFRENAKRSIVLVNGDMQINGVMTLNVCQQEKMLVKSILALHSTGHGPGHPGPTMKPGTARILMHIFKQHSSRQSNCCQHAKLRWLYFFQKDSSTKRLPTNLT